MSMQVSKMITNRSKEKIASLENTELLKRPGTATLERPSILDPSYLRKLDMSLISREKLMNIKNLLAKPHRHEDKSNGSSYDSILSDTSMNISDESIDSKFFIGSDDDTGKRNKKTGEKYNKNNKKKNQKTSKSKGSTKGNNDKSGDKEGNETNIDEYGDGLIWGEEDYRANEKTINRTYRVKSNRRQSIIGNTIEAPKEETSVTTGFSSSSPSPKCSLQKIDSPSISTPHEHKRDKKCKKSDETVNKSQPKLIVKKNVPMNKYSKKSVENLSLKKSKSKERINVKPADKSKKVVSNGVNKDKTLKENVKDIVDPKETTNVSKTSTENKKEKVDKMKYETVPRQKKNTEPGPLKQRATNPSHRRSISEVTKIELESKENTTPKRTFLRKNSRESNSPIVVRKFMDPITGKLRTVDEIPSSVKKIKETTLKVPNKADKQKTSRKACSSSENSPRKSSSGETLSNKLTSNCDSSSHKSFDCVPSRKSSVSETHKQCRKASLNIDITPRKVDKTENGNERRRSYFGQSGDTIFSTHIIAGEKYEDLFKKSDIIPRDDPVNPMSSELIRDETHSTERFNTNVEHNTPNGCDDQSVKSQNMALPPHNDFFSNGNMELLNMSEFRSLIVTPTFYTDDESWNSKLEGNSTGSLKKHKTIECNFCLKQFGTASFSFHEPHCRQVS